VYSAMQVSKSLEDRFLEITAQEGGVTIG
jgi:hypothetical protein